MSSFYGNGISAKEVKQEINTHIIFSKTEPTVQQAGDIWVVIGEFSDPPAEEDGSNDGGSGE